MKTYMILSTLLLSTFIGCGKEYNLQCSFLPFEIDLSQTAELIVRNDSGIDSLDFKNLKNDFKIVDTFYYSKNGLMTKVDSTEKVVCIIYNLAPLRTGEIKYSDGKLYLKNKEYKINSVNTLKVNETVEQSNSNINEPNNSETSFFNLNNLEITDTIDSRNIELIKKQFEKNQTKIISYIENQTYKIGDIIRIYYASNKNIDFELANKFNFKSLEILKQITKNETDNSSDNIAFHFLIFHFLAIEKESITIPLAKDLEEKYVSNSQTIIIK